MILPRKLHFYWIEPFAWSLSHGLGWCWSHRVAVITPYCLPFAFISAPFPLDRSVSIFLLGRSETTSLDEAKIAVLSVAGNSKQNATVLVKDRRKKPKIRSWLIRTKQRINMPPFFHMTLFWFLWRCLSPISVLMDLAHRCSSSSSFPFALFLCHFSLSPRILPNIAIPVARCFWNRLAFTSCPSPLYILHGAGIILCRFHPSWWQRHTLFQLPLFSSFPPFTLLFFSRKSALRQLAFSYDGACTHYLEPRSSCSLQEARLHYGGLMSTCTTFLIYFVYN